MLKASALIFPGLLSWTKGNCAQAEQPPKAQDSLWDLYDSRLKTAKYIDLTHAFAPTQPIWPGFGRSTFKPAIAGRTIDGLIKEGEEYDYAKHGFIATAFDLTTDQYGTQLDPPAHWNPLGATISDLPATVALRPLVVISIAEKVRRDEGYHLQVRCRQRRNCSVSVTHTHDGDSVTHTVSEQ